MFSSRDRKAFTLIELLVVIAIIAILAAILFPVFMTAKRAGQAKACFGNCKALGTAIVLYSDDNNGVLVPSILHEDAKEAAADYPSRVYWRKLLWPYVRSYNAYVCPSMKSEADVRDPRPSQDVPATYGINSIVVSVDSYAQSPSATTQYVPRRSSEYSRPSKIIVLTEIRKGGWATGSGLLQPVCLLGDPNGATPKDRKPWVPRWHNNMLNVAFMDGHCRTMYMYDTIGATVSDWMWWDPKIFGVSSHALASEQQRYRDNWPKNYPPFGDADMQNSED